MIITYATKEYYQWAEIFLTSFSLFHNNDIKIHINTRNFSDSQINKLSEIYPNLTIKNKFLSVEDLSKKFNIPVQQIEDSRLGCCGKGKKNNHRLWMNITADGDRINEYLTTVKENIDTEKSFFLTDIDFLFRSDIYHTLEKIKDFDVGLKIRAAKKQTEKGNMPKSLNINAKRVDSLINISTVSINNTEQGISFLESWIKHVNSVPMKDRNHLKWGQYAIVLAYNEVRQNTNFFRHVSTFDPSLSKESKVWFFKSKEKFKDLQKAKNELKRIKNEK